MFTSNSRMGENLSDFGQGMVVGARGAGVIILVTTILMGYSCTIVSL